MWINMPKTSSLLFLSVSNFSSKVSGLAFSESESMAQRRFIGRAILVNGKIPRFTYREMDNYLFILVVALAHITWASWAPGPRSCLR